MRVGTPLVFSTEAFSASTRVDGGAWSDSAEKSHAGRFQKALDTLDS